MKVDLNVSAASNVLKMSNCPRNTEGLCGVMYRSN